MAHPVRKPTETEAEIEDHQELRAEMLARSRNPVETLVTPRPFEPANTQMDPATASGRGLSPGAVILGLAVVLAIIALLTFGQRSAQTPESTPAAQTDQAPATASPAPAGPAPSN